MEQNLIDKYKEETYELLTEIESLLLDLEDTGEDTDMIICLFGLIHTIKGSASMFGFDDIEAFAHQIEAVFEGIRDQKFSITKKLTDMTLLSCDQIRKMVDGDTADISETYEFFRRFCQTENEAEPRPEDSEHRVPTTDLRTPSIYQIRFRPSPDIFKSGMNPLRLLDELRLLGECRLIGHTDAIPSLKEMNPERSYLYWDVTLKTAEEMDAIRDVFIFAEGDDCELSIEMMDETGESEKKSNNIPLKCAPNLGMNHHVMSSVVRVPADKLDSLMDLVGELVTFQSALNRKALLQKDPELRFIAHGIERLTEDLRFNTMSIRMIPIGTMFSTFKRLVRDLSKALGKTVVMTTKGKDTELDKTIIDRLNDSLIHIIRNCIDHGIEPPDIREISGKPKHGTVCLSAEHSGPSVVIRISDDGRGINMKEIRAKAEAKGLMVPGLEVPENRLLEQIFTPGFSTAKEVTGISGRGIGMDVVKRCISDMRGTVEISSKKGRGTTIILKLPLTLSIIDGLLVKIGNEKFILPLSVVEECLEMKYEETIRAEKRNLMSLRGEMIPYLSLRSLLMIKGAPASVQRVVISETNGERIGLGIDEVVGQYQTVIKPLGKIYKNTKGISGATIMGDGTVALIIDVNQLLQASGHEI